ncbi:MAG: HAMP domain-containing sensor histidine kinase [Pseudomonadota bacterium]
MIRLVRSATGRLLAAHLALTILITTAVLGTLYWRMTGLIETEVREVVATELDGLADDYGQGGMLGLARAIERRLATAAQRDAVYLLTDRFGRPLAGNLQAWPPTVPPAAGWVSLSLYRTDRDRVAEVEGLVVGLAGGERLLVGRDADARRLLEQVMLSAGAVALGAALVLGLLAGWLLSRFVLSRIGEIQRTAGEIVEGDLARRVPMRGSGDEFDRMAGTLNAMLDRNEALVDSLRTVTDSLAHDLRSPLTRLRAITEELAAPDQAPERRADLAARATAEADGVLSTFSSLIEIARAEAGLGREAFQTVDLAEMADEIGALYAPAATEAGVALAVDAEAVCVSAHRQLLAQALANLVHNALRYAPTGSTVRIATGAMPQPWISVEDHGPGIPQAERTRVLGRFVTLDPSRGEGSGLGLALVIAFAKLHGGSLTLGDAAPEQTQPGLSARITLRSADP